MRVHWVLAGTLLLGACGSDDASDANANTTPAAAPPPSAPPPLTPRLDTPPVENTSVLAAPVPASAVDTAGPAASRPSPATMPATTRFRCMDGNSITARFDNVRDSATITRGGKRLAVLQGQRPASGLWYRAAGYELRGNDDDVTFTQPGLPPLACRAIRSR